MATGVTAPDLLTRTLAGASDQAKGRHARCLPARSYRLRDSVIRWSKLMCRTSQLYNALCDIRNRALLQERLSNMPVVYAGFNRPSARANFANDTVFTKGLANCISVYCIGGSTGQSVWLAHYDTMHCMNGDMSCNVHELQQFENWMTAITSASTYVISLGAIWDGNARVNNLKNGIRTAFVNAHIFDTCTSAIAYQGENHTGWALADIAGIPAALTNEWDNGGSNQGQLIPYGNFFPANGPGGCLIS